MFSSLNRAAMFARTDRFEIEMQAIGFKQEAQQLQLEGRYEEALPLMPVSYTHLRAHET